MGQQVLRASWPLWEAVWITVRPEIRFSFLPHPCCVTLAGGLPSLSLRHLRLEWVKDPSGSNPSAGHWPQWVQEKRGPKKLGVREGWPRCSCRLPVSSDLDPALKASSPSISADASPGP